MRRILTAGVMVVIGLSACTKSPTTTTIAGPAGDQAACAAIVNMVVGTYANTDQATRDAATKSLIQLAEKAENPDLGNEARQLQADANSANQSAIDLGQLGQTCANLGLFPGR